MANLYESKKEGAPAVNVQASKTTRATVSQQTVTPDNGYDAMAEIVVNPQNHTATHTEVTTNYPAGSPLDLGENHNYRYVPINVQGTAPEITLTFSANATAFSAGINSLNSVVIFNPSNFSAAYSKFKITSAVGTPSPVSLNTEYQTAGYSDVRVGNTTTVSQASASVTVKFYN